MLAAFWVVSFAVVMTPGADWAYAITAGTRDRAIVPAILGILGGYLAITIVVAAGLGSLLASIPAALPALTLLGAAYLFWLGLHAIFGQARAVATLGEERTGDPLGWLMRGVAISGMNPKALLLLLAILPQFISAKASWPASGQMMTLGLVQIANCAIVYSLVALGARAMLSGRPEAARRVGQLAGLAMIAMAMTLAVEPVSLLVAAR